MNYFQAMGIRTRNILIAGFVLFLAAACDPPTQFCDDIGTFAVVPDIFTIEPLQDTYNKGDVVTLKGSIANISHYFSEPTVNLFEITRQEKASLMGGDSTLFESNFLNFMKGSQGEYPNWFNMPYNPETDRYEFELKITLERTGAYNFSTYERIDIIGEGCDKFTIDTNIAGANEDRRIVFEVLE